MMGGSTLGSSDKVSAVKQIIYQLESSLLYHKAIDHISFPSFDAIFIGR